MRVASPHGEIHVAVEGGGPDVLMLMGAGAPGRVWEAGQAPGLRDAGFRTWVVDWRGTGRSGPWGPCEDWTACVDDARAVLDAAEESGAGPFAVVGTSMGARVTLHLAASEPRRVVLAVAMALGDRPGPAGELYARAMASCMSRGVDESVWAAVQAMSLSPATLRDPVRGRDYIDMLSLSSPPEGCGGHFASGDGEPEEAVRIAETVKCPLWGVAFADDVIAPPETVRSLVGRVPRSEYREIPDAGHIGYLEQPTATQAVLREALECHRGHIVPAGGT